MNANEIQNANGSVKKNATRITMEREKQNENEN